MDISTCWTTRQTARWSLKTGACGHSIDPAWDSISDQKPIRKATDIVHADEWFVTFQRFKQVRVVLFDKNEGIFAQHGVPCFLIPDQGVFLVFRFRGPLEGYINTTRVLNDFEEVQ